MTTNLIAQDMEKHRWADRLIVIYADLNSEQALQQQELLKANTESLRERKVKVYLTDGTDYLYDFDDRVEKINRPFELKQEFKVELIGLDGGVKYSSDKVVDLEVFESLIDAMPMRRSEMRNKG